MLVGVPWNWIQTAPAGDLVIDPTTTVAANEDVKLQDDTGNYGSDVMLAAGKQTGATRRRSLVKFNLSSIPGNAVVLNARLRLYQQDAFSNNDTTDWVDRWVQAHQLLVD